MVNRPNILIFMTDQERADVVAPDHPCLTPNSDRLAQTGIRFTQTYCPSPHCCPSRATFMSGLYPSRHGIFNNIKTHTAINTSLRPDVVLFSEQLKEAGYRNVLCGKWHVSGRRRSQGSRVGRTRRNGRRTDLSFLCDRAMATGHT